MQMDRTLTGQGTAEGLVTDVIYENESTGYKVVEIEMEDGDEAVLVGTMPSLKIGEHVSAEGIWTEHPSYGLQMKVRTYTNTLPRTREAVERYLGSGAIKGIGPAMARRIVECFGDETLEVFENEPERLSEVKGISTKTAMKLGEEYQRQFYLRTTIMELQQYGIQPSLAAKLYEQYKERTVQTLRTNPYALADDVKGIGFRRADEIASSMGMPADSPSRIRAAIKYVLAQACEQGHTYLTESQLEEAIYELTGIGGIDFENMKLQLILDKQIVEEEQDGITCIYLASFYQAEKSVASRIISLNQKQIHREEDLEGAVARAEKKYSIQLDEQQKKAVMTAMGCGVMVITGGPGTGKTTIINILLELLDELDEDYLLCAPTGRAAKRMSEATGREARTIHRMLEPGGDQEHPNSGLFRRNEDNPLETDFLIVDEVSMVDILLMNHLLKAILPETVLILVGDKDQLPSVGPGNVLKDLIDSKTVEVVRLEQIFRQGEQSHIVTNAHKILNGQYPTYNTKGTDFFLVTPQPDMDPSELLLDVVKRRLPKYLHCSPVEDIQVLTPMRKGPFGVEQLNALLQNALNPPSKEKKEIEFRSGILREGDKVMQIRNDYDLSWQITNKFGYPLDEGQGVFNGDIGRIMKVNLGDKSVRVRFDDDHEITYEYASLEELDLAYAITIHKAQGSESPVVVMPLLGGSSLLFCRNLLYTGITRARKLVAIVGFDRVVRNMVDNDRPALRNSTLCRRLEEVKEQKTDRAVADRVEAIGLTDLDIQHIQQLEV